MYIEMIKLNKVKVAHSVEEMQKLISEGYVPMHSKSEQPEPDQTASNDQEQPDQTASDDQKQPDQTASDDQKQPDQTTPDESQSLQPEKGAGDTKTSGRGRGSKAK